MTDNKARLERVLKDMDGEPIGDISIDVEGTEEFSGLMKIELNLDSLHGIDRQAVKLTIPADADLVLELKDILSDALKLLRMPKEVLSV